jgi:sugar O-acyltransferase (sialic acid O-acetyltransferase NeuD family)
MKVVLYGSRIDGHARVVYETLVPHGAFEVIGLIDDEPDNAANEISQLKVVGSRRDLPRLNEEGVEGVLLGFGSAHGREDVVRASESAGLSLPVLAHPSAELAGSARLSPGSQVMPQVNLGPNASVGVGVLLNTGCILEHDVEVAAYSVVAPGAVIAGRARIGQSVELGAGSVVLPDIAIGARAVVGAGSVVTTPVAPGVTVMGVPARPRSA